MANLSNINNKFLVTTGGNVGIGDTGPSTKLTVDVPAVLNNTVNLFKLGDDTNGLVFKKFWDSGGIAWRLNKGISGINMMTFSQDGKVGIGTTLPGQKLDVNGTIRISTSGTVEGRSYPYTTNLGSGADATTTYLVAGSTASLVTSIDLAGASAANPKTIIFKTASTERMRIDSSGNVGIGTALPEQKLHVEGASITVNRGNDDSSIAFQNSTSGATWRIGRDYSNSEALTFAYSATDYPSLTGNGLVYINTSGNVGIGATSPNEKLVIRETSNTATTRIKIEGGSYGFTFGKTNQESNYAHLRPRSNSPVVFRLMPNVGPNYSYMELWGTDYESNTTNYNRLMFYINGSTGDANIKINKAGSSPAGNLYIGTASSEQAITILNSGNVGIGTTSPTSKLHLRDPGTNSDVGIKIGNDSRDWNLKVMGSVSDSLQFFTHDNSNVMTILPSGNVGIGNTAPRDKLTVFTAGAAEEEIALRLVNPVGFTNVGSGASIIFAQDRNTGENLPMAKIRSSQSIAGTSSYGDLIFSTLSSTMQDRMTILSSGNVGIGVTPTQKLDVAGIVKHLGLDMTAGIQVDQITSISSSLSGAAGSWHETGIDGTDIGNSGSYMIQVYSNTQGAGASNYSMYWTGTMSWYYAGTNSVNTSEIYLNSAGHYRGMDLELRTISSLNNATPPSMRIQFKSNQTLTGHAVVFKFRRLM
jgi:hypothetical protein